MLPCLHSLFDKRVSYLDDLSANLICKKIKKRWICELRNISGTKKQEIVQGSNSILLDELLPENIKEKHSFFMNNILDLGTKSTYWNMFLEGKMQRSVIIVNPYSKEKFNVKMKIIFVNKSWLCGQYYFKMTLSDVTYVENLSTSVSLITHDLRSVFRSIKKISDDLKVSNESDKESLFDTLDMLTSEGLILCSKSRDDFNEKSQTVCNKLNKVYISLYKLIKNLNIIYGCRIVFDCCCNLFLNNDQLTTIKHILFNAVKNSINANASIIIVRVKQENLKLILMMIDNGIGMSDEKIKNFFNREIKKNSGNVDDNRGEGMLLSCLKWKSIDGEIEIFCNGEMTFIFTIETPISQCPVLNLKQLKMLSMLKSCNKLNILIVDDSIVKLKMTMRLLNMKLDLQKNGEEQTSSIINLPKKFEIYIMNEYLEYNIIFATNGVYAFDVYNLVNIHKIVTDLQMPIMDGYELIKNVIAINKKQEIMINSDTDKFEVYQKLQIVEGEHNIKFI